MIDKYKSGQLSDEEMEKVEEGLLQKLAEQQRDDVLRQNLRMLATTPTPDFGVEEKPIAPAPSSKLIYQRLWVALAAAAILLLGILGWWWMQSDPTVLNASQLAMKYLRQENAPILNNSMAGDTLNATEQAARNAYLQKDYQTATRLYQTLPPHTAAHYFYLGIAALKQTNANFNLARISLLQARKLGNGWQEDAINWHLALLYLGQNNTPEARKELDNIIKIDRDNVQKANTLIELLQSNPKEKI